MIRDGKDGKRALWLRPLGSTTATRVPETEDASYPFWSPDGRYVAFFADAKLKKIDLSGGSPQVICNAPSGRGGSWGRDGVIIFAPSLRSGIYRVSANGGPITPIVPDSKDGQTTYRWPHLLPDGKPDLYVKKLSGGDIEPIVESAFWKATAPWLPAGDAFVFGEQNNVTNYDLWLWSLRDRKRLLLVKTPFDEYWPAASPDGHWLAYRSNER